MDPGTLAGIGLAFGAIFASMILEGGSPASIMLIPPIVLVFGGTLGAAMAGGMLKDFLGIVGSFQRVFLGKAVASDSLVDNIVKLAEKARREGLLALEDEAENVEDPFIKKGISLVVDGTDPELVKDILESDLDAMEARHSQQASLFQNAGGFAPTLGIIGTVMGLVHVLENLSDPNSLGPAISTAFIATFYGVASANLYYLPIGNKLKKITHEEVHSRTMIIEGIVSIQAGDNPRVVEEKLKTFLDPAERAALEGGGDQGDDGLAKAA